MRHQYPIPDDPCLTTSTLCSISIVFLTTLGSLPFTLYNISIVSLMILILLISESYSDDPCPATSMLCSISIILLTILVLSTFYSMWHQFPVSDNPCLTMSTLRSINNAFLTTPGLLPVTLCNISFVTMMILILLKSALFPLLINLVMLLP
jgi:hypothetical protein